MVQFITLAQPVLYQYAVFFCVKTELFLAELRFDATCPLALKLALKFALKFALKLERVLRVIKAPLFAKVALANLIARFKQ